MRVWGYWLVVAAALGGCAAARPRACSSMPDGSERPVVMGHWREGIVVDGSLVDWEGIEFREVGPVNGVFDPQPGRSESAEDLSFRFAVCYDLEALYVAVEVRDDVMVADSCAAGSVSCAAWDDDAVEVFIDGNHNHAVNARRADGAELRYGGEFALVANGAANSDFSGYPRTHGALWRGAVGGEGRRVYELRLGWGVLGRKLAAGERAGFTVSVQDDDDGGGRDHALYFCGWVPSLFSDERGFADLILSGE